MLAEAVADHHCVGGGGVVAADQISALGGFVLLIDHADLEEPAHDAGEDGVDHTVQSAVGSRFLFLFLTL